MQLLVDADGNVLKLASVVLFDVGRRDFVALSIVFGCIIEKRVMRDNLCHWQCLDPIRAIRDEAACEFSSIFAHSIKTVLDPVFRAPSMAGQRSSAFATLVMPMLNPIHLVDKARESQVGHHLINPLLIPCFGGWTFHDRATGMPESRNKAVVHPL